MGKYRYRPYNEERKPAIIFFSFAALFFLLVIGFFSWHTVRMRSYELDFVRTQGIVTGYETHHSSTSGHGSTTYYYYKVTYEYSGEEYTFTDRTGHRAFSSSMMGASMEIYVNPQSPSQAESVSSSAFLSII